MQVHPGRWKWRIAILTALLAAPGAAETPVVGAVRLAAQERAPGEPPPSCFRGRPLPVCSTFWLLEMQGVIPVMQTTRPVSYGRVDPVETETYRKNLELNIGRMRNLNPTLAVGGTVTLGGIGSGGHIGVRARVRRWMEPDLALEVSGGVLRADRFVGSTGLTDDARLNLRDQGAAFVRWDGVSLPRVDRPEEVDAGGFQQAVSVGVSAGSGPAVVLTGVALAVLFAALRALASG